MFERYLEFAKGFGDLELVELIERAEKAEEKELVDLIPKIREGLLELLKRNLSDRAFELAKCLSLIDKVDEVARDVYSKRFEDYDSLLEELLGKGILRKRVKSYGMNDVAKEILEDLAGRNEHELAVEYYSNFDDFTSRAKLAYHMLRAGRLDEALKEFIDLSNQMLGRHECIEILVEVGERLANHYEGDERCRILGTLGNLYLILKKYEEAEANYRSVLDYYMKQEDPKYRKFVAGVLHNLGKLYALWGDLNKAENMLVQSLRVKLEDGEEVSELLRDLADVYMAKGDFDNAEKCLHDALKEELSKKNDEKVAELLNNLGYLYSKKGDLEKAERYYKEALRVYSALDDPKAKMNMSAVLSNLSSLYMNSGNLDGAEEILEVLESKSDEIPPDVKATFYMNLAKALEMKGDNERASEFYLKAGALGFLVFRNYGVNAVNFMHCFDKAEQLGKGKLKGDAKMMKAVIMRMYYGVKASPPEVEEYGWRGRALMDAWKGKRAEIKLEDEVDMAIYVLANELMHFNP